MASSEDKEVEEKLLEAGNKLFDPPSSPDELLLLLEQVENCLSKVQQSPTDSMQLALNASLRALIADKLFRHTDVDVKVAVASCISEITRITAPEAPYNDDQMKDVFQLIVSSFKNLDDKSSPSYVRRTMILDTVAKVRSCVVMLDRECDSLIVEMFQLFLNLIRDYHPENVFSSMETIMTLVLEESEDICVELLSPLLASMKRDNKDVLPIARKLGEKVLKNCASKVEPYLTNAVRSLGVSVEESISVVTSICPKLSFIVESNDGHAADENNVGAASEEAAEADTELEAQYFFQADTELEAQAAPDNKVEPANDDTLNVVVTNGVSQLGEDDEKLVHSTSLKNTEDGDHTNQEKPQNLDVETTKETDNNLEYTAKKKGRKVIITKRRVELLESSQIGDRNEKLMDDKSNVEGISSLPCRDQLEEAASENKELEAEPSSPKAMESDSGNFVSPTVSENLRDESLSNKARWSMKGRLIKDFAASSDTGLENAEAATDSDAEQHKRPGKTGSVMISDIDKALVPKDSSKKQRGTASKSEEKPFESPESSQIGERNEKLMDDKSNVEGISSLPCRDQLEEAASENKELEAEPSSPKAMESDSGNFVSPTVSENLRDESLSNKAQWSKKGRLIKDFAASSDTGLENAEAATDSDAEQHKRSGKTGSVMISDIDKALVPKDSSKKQRGTASKSEEKPLKQLSKVTTGSTNGERSSLRQSDDKKCQSRGKAVLETDMIKNSTKIDGKENISSLKSDVKPIKDHHAEKETPGAVKRKQIPDASKEYGEEVVGKKVKIWWPIDQQFYKGKIDSFDNQKKRHTVVYDDGDVEVLNLKRQKFEFIGSNLESDEEEPADDGSADEEADMYSKKKVKTNSNQSKRQGKMEASPKQSGASSSKAKSASAKTGQKSKESSRTDGWTVDDSKARRKTEDDVVTKGKDHHSKTGCNYSDVSKSASKTKGNDVPAITGKSKEDFTSAANASKSKPATPKSGKLKLDSSKASPSPKVKLLVSDGRPNANDGKLKSGSKEKAMEEDEDSRRDSDEVHEIAEGKVTSSTKGQGSKSGKKWRRGA